MKIIEIFQENAPTVELFDDDDGDKLEYVMLLKELLRSNEIKVIETTSGCAIVKPSQIKLILVKESNNNRDDEQTDREEEFDNQNTDGDFIGDE